MLAFRQCWRSYTMGAALLLVLAQRAPAHTIPDEVTVQAFAKPENGQLHILVRVPFEALADTVFPLRERGALDLPRVNPMLADAAKIWIADWITVSENGALLPNPRISNARISLAADGSFASYQQAWARLTGPALLGDSDVYPARAAFDVLLDYPIYSERSDFTMRSGLARLGGRVVTTLRYMAPAGEERAFAYVGNPGPFAPDPGRYQVIRRFIPLGFTEILQGSDYLLFLLCAALLFGRWLVPVRFVVAFALGHSATLIASAYGFAPEGLWFPVLFQVVVALSIVYLALENIFARATPDQLWMAAIAFGLAYGFAFSFALRPALQFGGSHELLSILAFNTGLELGIVAILLIATKLLSVIGRFESKERIATMFLAGLAGHTGWHRLLERASWLTSSDLQWPSLDATPPASINNFALSAALVTALLAATYFGGKALKRRFQERA